MNTKYWTLILSILLISSITFAQDTLYIYKSGSVVVKRAVTEIDSVIFYKPALTPVLTTLSISNITQTTATSGGNITSAGSSAVKARGVCLSTSSNPTINNNKTTDGSGTGLFTSSITGLTANTVYYVRAYATNNSGTAYGSQVKFTAATSSLPTVTTDSVSSIVYNSATCGGRVTNAGSGSITARGVCWSTSSSPTISNNKTTDGTGTGSFTSSITGLTASTVYYVRAYATNSSGTSYGNEIMFTTISLANSFSYNQCDTSGYIVDYVNYNFQGILCISDLIDVENGINVSKAQFKYRFGTLLGYATNSGIFKWTGSTGKNKISTIDLRAKVYNSANKFTGYYYYYSPLVVSTDNTWSWDVSGSPDWNNIFKDSSGTYMDQTTTIKLFKSGFRLLELEIVKLNGKTRLP